MVMSYAVEWIVPPIVLGAVLLPLIIGPFALIALMVVALTVLAAVVALAAAVLATPYLLVGSLRRRLAERRRSAEGSGPVARVMAETGRATQQSGVAALAE
jgi:uncharacterized SAM-binding protein YcdF (DUF218 family)